MLLSFHRLNCIHSVWTVMYCIESRNDVRMRRMLLNSSHESLFGDDARSLRERTWRSEGCRVSLDCWTLVRRWSHFVRQRQATVSMTYGGRYLAYALSIAVSRRNASSSQGQMRPPYVEPLLPKHTWKATVRLWRKDMVMLMRTRSIALQKFLVGLGVFTYIMAKPEALVSAWLYDSSPPKQ